MDIHTMKTKFFQKYDPLQNFQMRELSDEEISRKQEKIIAKLKAGRRLTGEEKSFLLKYAPDLYQVAKRVEAQREALENQLKHARSKEEVNSAIGNAISNISKKDPSAEYVIAAVMNEAKEFKSSSQYKKLPATQKDAHDSNKKSYTNKTDKITKSERSNLYNKEGKLL